jgi:hypothetical protein
MKLHGIGILQDLSNGMFHAYSAVKKKENYFNSRIIRLSASRLFIQFYNFATKLHFYVRI